eukprot:TRINITY_DN3234_c0_g1_i2.p1 TRINITY_DN3234_c0_g1~~TRINITY_DN3234_c0_g1_i2.p1  ORF type:complete len:759 (-),score=88.28 TRINITY_DN3234_c0_g1_i2:485-2761(-)
MTTVITSHVGADADSIGSMVAAKKMYPNSYLLWPGTLNEVLEKVIAHYSIHVLRSLDELDITQVSLLVIVDARSLTRVKHVELLIERYSLGFLDIHVYDHHPSSLSDVPCRNENFFINECGAASSFLVQILKTRNIDLTENEATIIGLGIYEDTGNFLHSSTTVVDFESAAYLKTKGMDLSVICKYLYDSKEIGSSRLTEEESNIYNQLVESLSSFKIGDENISIAMASHTKEPHSFSTLVKTLMQDNGLSTLFCLGAFDRDVLVVGRSKEHNHHIDVSAVCRSFGGGGHFAAASARVKGTTIVEVREKLYSHLCAILQPDKYSMKSLMTVPAVTIASDQSTNTCCTLFRNFNLKRIPVVDSNTKQFVGIVDRTILEKARGHGLGEHAVHEFMETTVKTLTSDQSITQVIDLVMSSNQRMVPIVSPENNTVIGVISRADVVNLLMKEPGKFPMKKREERNLSKLAETRLPSDLYKLLVSIGQLADKMDCNVYVVGGFVRDLIMNKENDDVDLVVEGDGLAFSDLLAKEMGSGKAKHHEQFKTAKVTLKSGLKIDVTTARLEYYPTPVALPTVELSSLKMDLYRRDFSINAMAMQLNGTKFGMLCDFFSGARDIESGVISVLHSLSFVEDPTRILRAIRFEQRYQFNMCGQTERLLKSTLNMGHFQKLSGSRLFHEIEKIFDDEKPVECLIRMEKSFNILTTIHHSFCKFQVSMMEKAVEIHNLVKLLKISEKYTLWKFYLLVLVYNLKYGIIFCFLLI